MALATAAAGNATRVLLVEDNPGDVELARSLLHEENGDGRFALRCASRLADAVRLLEAGPVDAILLDLRLPDADGLETLDRLRAAAPDAPIIVLTALADEDLAVAALHRGAQEYLVKGSLGAHDVGRTIRHAIERQRLRREIDQANADLRAANARLDRLSRIDPLTELLNRRGLQEALSREILRAPPFPLHLFALLVDLDNFKQINDNLGYAVGDAVLTEIGTHLSASIRPSDYAARIGGDEFVVLLPQTRTAEGRAIAERVRRAATDARVSLPSGGAVHVTASVGAVALAEPPASVDELLSALHSVLRRSKVEGKNRVSLDREGAEPASPAPAPRADLRDAVEDPERISIVAQPILRLADMRPIGIELLARFAIPDCRMPEDFFHAAGEGNLLTLADHRCLRRALQAARNHPPDLRVHVNLFPSTLLNVPVEHLLRDFPPDRPPGSWCVEIGERHIVGNPSHLVEPIGALRRAGIRVALDDVGFGHTSLESLVLLEPDVVKIDRGSVTGIGADRRRERPLRRLLQVAGSLGAEVIAEGIETEEDLEAVRSLGVGFGQGFLLGRPR